jgi:hypothetical protein
MPQHEVLQGDTAAAWPLLRSPVRNIAWCCKAGTSKSFVFVQQITRHAVPCILWLFIAAAAGAAAEPLYPNSSCHNTAQVRQQLDTCTWPLRTANTCAPCAMHIHIRHAV